MNTIVSTSTATHPTSAYTPTEAARLLAATTSTLLGLLLALPPALLVWQPAPGEWSALEVVGHLVEADARGFGGRLRTLQAEERSRFTGWEPDEVARERRDNARDSGELLAEFVQGRQAHLVLLETLTHSDLDRRGDHPQVGWLTARDLLHEWVHHDADHLRQILANVQAYTWPHLGNAKRFSGDG